MISIIRPLLNGVVLFVVLLLALSPLRLTYAQSSDAVKIKVEITDAGLRCAPESNNCLGIRDGQFTIQVEQGQAAELTFVWAHQGYIQDEHILILEGYGLESEKLTSQHKESIFKFIADKPGQFRFKCDLQCEIHDTLQKGRLSVTRGGSGGSNSAASLTPTTLTLSSSSTITTGEPVSFTAVLKDRDGAPVSKAEVHFYVDAEFAGSKGKMAIGLSKTDAKGVALLDYKPTIEMEKHTISASFEGVGIYAESQQATDIQQIGPTDPAYQTAPVGLEGVKLWVKLTVVVIIGSVWLTFGFVLFQAMGVAWVRDKR